MVKTRSKRGALKYLDYAATCDKFNTDTSDETGETSNDVAGYETADEGTDSDDVPLAQRALRQARRAEELGSDDAEDPLELSEDGWEPAASPRAAPRSRAVLRVMKTPMKRSPRKVARLQVLELSVTVSIGGSDLPDEGRPLLTKLEKFLTERCLAGMFSLERGGSLLHLHAQGVVRIESTCAATVSKLVKKALGWDVNKPAGALVMCRTLAQRGLHTFTGMLGYCSKDAMEPHFARVLHNVTEADLEDGLDVYIKFGKGELKNRVMLNPNNMFERAQLYFMYRWRGRKGEVDIERVLLRMMRTGKYAPSAQFVIPYQGRGMERRRANALWRMIIAPSTTEQHHINDVFFAREQGRYHEGLNVHIRSDDPSAHPSDMAGTPAASVQCAPLVVYGDNGTPPGSNAHTSQRASSSRSAPRSNRTR